MANTLVTRQEITFKCLDEFINQLNVVKHFNTDWASEFGNKGQKIGDTLKVKKPQRWIVASGAAYVNNPIVDTYATVTVNRHRHIGFDYGAFEATLSLDDIYNRYFKTSIAQLANQVDFEACEFAYLNTNNYTGLQGTDPTSTLIAQQLFLNALAGLQENGSPTDDLSVILAPRQNVGALAQLTTMFNPQSTQSAQYKSGEMGASFGFARIAVDQNILRHTVGTFVGTPAVATTSASGDTTLATNGWTAGDVINAGDIFSVASVNNVNPKSRQSTGIVKRFVNLTTQTAPVGGLLTLSVSPDITGPATVEQYATVDALPVAGALITMWPLTTSPSGKVGAQGLAFHRNAFAFVPIQLPKMEGLAISEVARDPKTGISLAINAGWDVTTYQRINRIDIGFGFGALYPDNCSQRVVGA